MFRMLVIVLAVFASLVCWNGGFARDSGPAMQATIADLLRRPDGFDGKAVTVTGAVGGRVSVLGLGAFQLEDGAGNTIGVAGLAAPPQPGETIAVTGVFHMAVTAGAWQWPVILARQARGLRRAPASARRFGIRQTHQGDSGWTTSPGF